MILENINAGTAPIDKLVIELLGIGKILPSLGFCLLSEMDLSTGFHLRQASPNEVKTLLVPYKNFAITDASEIMLNLIIWIFGIKTFSI